MNIAFSEILLNKIINKISWYDYMAMALYNFYSCWYSSTNSQANSQVYNYSDNSNKVDILLVS